MNLRYGNGNVSIDNNSEIVAIQIHYNGNLEVNSLIPDEYILYKSKNKIIIYSMELLKLPLDLFSYSGNFKITKCISSDSKANKIKTTIKNNYLGFWVKQNTNWESGEIWDDIKGTHYVGKKVIKNQLIMPELTKEQKLIVKKTKKLRGR